MITAACTRAVRVDAGSEVLPRATGATAVLVEEFGHLTELEGFYLFEFSHNSAHLPTLFSTRRPYSRPKGRFDDQLRDQCMISHVIST